MRLMLFSLFLVLVLAVFFMALGSNFLPALAVGLAFCALLWLFDRKAV